MTRKNYLNPQPHYHQLYHQHPHNHQHGPPTPTSISPSSTGSRRPVMSNHNRRSLNSNGSSSGSSNRMVGVAMFAGMAVALLYQMGYYGFSIMMETNSLSSARKHRQQLQQEPTIVKAPTVPREEERLEDNEHAPPIDVGLLLQQQPQEEPEPPRKSPINQHLVSGDIARMIAQKLAKQYEFNPEEEHVGEAEEPRGYNQVVERKFSFQDAFARDTAQEHPPRNSKKSRHPDDYDEDEEDVDEQGFLPPKQPQQQETVSSNVVPIPIVSSQQVPKGMPKYEGELPDDWNAILKLRREFMAKHHPPPKATVTIGKGISVRLPQLQQPPQQPQFGPNGEPIILLRSDALYQKGTWDKSPIIIEKYKLVFFTVPKVGCTAFKQLFRRIMGYDNWKDHQYYNEPFLPHNPDTNGLKYLSDYPFEQANEMLTSDEWTRAIFVRKPEERVLSAFLDKAAYSKGYYLRMRCCPKFTAGTDPWKLLQCGTGTKQYTPPAPGETNTPIMTFEQFLTDIMPHCSDPHWEPQAIRMAPKYWERINFVGRFESLQEDTKALLTKLDDAWDTYGAKGWDDGGAIFDTSQKAKHGTKAQDKDSKSKFFTKDALTTIASYYDADYVHDKLNFERPVID